MSCVGMPWTPNCWLDHSGQLCWSLGPSWAPWAPGSWRGSWHWSKKVKSFPLDLAASCQVLPSSELIQFRKKSTSLNLRIFSRTFRSRKNIVFLDISTSPGRRDHWIWIPRPQRPGWNSSRRKPCSTGCSPSQMTSLRFVCFVTLQWPKKNSRILTGRILKNRLENLEMEIIQLKSGFAGSKMVNSHVCLQHFPALRIKWEGHGSKKVESIQ